MGYHALNSLEIWDRMAQFLMNGKMHLHCVCGGSESEYTSGQKDFILGPRLGGGGGEGEQQVFSSLQEVTENFKATKGEQMFFQHMFLISGPPLVVIMTLP